MKPKRIVHRAAFGMATLGALLLWAATAHASSLVGGLYVTTEPAGAEVYVAGELKGVSPCAIPDVGIGTVEVKAVKEGYGTVRQMVQVESEKIATVALRLSPLANVGSILVMVEPTGSDVEVDRVPFGKTPARIINVEAGTHRVRVSRAGHRPLYADVTVVTGQEQVVRGRLIEGGGWLGETTGAGEEEPFGELAPEQVPTPDQMPEAKAFEPVRELLAERRYDEAVEQLGRMATEPDTARYMARIARDRRYAQAAKGVIEAACKALREKVGQTYPLLLRGGISLEGKLLGVSETHVTVDIDGTGAGKQIALDRIHIDRVVKLSASAYPPDRPENQALFAVLYAMEGEFSSAYEALRRAAAGGHNVTDAKSFVDSERLWAAAQKKQRIERQRAERREELEREREALAGQAGRGEPVVLVDGSRGGALASEITRALEQVGLRVRETSRAAGEDELKAAAVLVVSAPGEAEDGRAYEEAEVKRIAEFVRSGGGFVFFAAPRAVGRGPVHRGTPLDALLAGEFRISVRPGRMTVQAGAPRDHPRYRATAVPTQRHPITSGVGDVRFDLRTPAVVAPPVAVIMATPPFISSSATGRGPVPLVAARTFGRGRVVVFGSVPDTWDEDTGVQAVRLCLNAIRWAAYPKAQASRATQ